MSPCNFDIWIGPYRAIAFMVWGASNPGTFWSAHVDNTDGVVRPNFSFEIFS